MQTSSNEQLVKLASVKVGAMHSLTAEEMPTEDKTAGGQAGEGRLLADLMGTRRAREVIKLHSTMASPLVNPLKGRY